MPDLRIILWDIDGTLLRTRRAGSFRDYTGPVLARMFGTAGRLGEMTVSGMTDLQIVSEALRDAGVTPEEIRVRAPRVVRARAPGAAQVLRVRQPDAVSPRADRHLRGAARPGLRPHAALVDAPPVDEKVLARAHGARLQLVAAPADLRDDARAFAPHFERDPLAFNLRVEFHKKLSAVGVRLSNP